MPQVVGSDDDTYSCTINADLTAGVLTFTGGSTITANLNPTAPFTPNANPGVDNYAFFTNVAPVRFDFVKYSAATRWIAPGVTAAILSRAFNA